MTTKTNIPATNDKLNTNKNNDKNIDKNNDKSNDISKNKITEGTIWKQLLIFFFPIAFGSLFQQLYNVVDAAIVGRYVGKAALASVGGSSSVIIGQIVSFFAGLSAGATVVISQYWGAKDEENLSKSLHTAYAFACVGSIIIASAGLTLAPWMLRIMQTPEEIIAASTIYLRIFFFGIPAALIYNIGSGIMRAIGDSKRPLYVLILCSILNIVLDILFVVVFNMGIAGAALATILSQFVSAVVVTGALMHLYDNLKLKLHMIRFHLPILKRVLFIGLPGGIQACMYGLTNVIIQSAINSFGTDTAAAWAAYGKSDLIFWAVCNAFGISVCTFVGQNYGAEKMDRVYRSVRISLAMALGICSSIIVLLLLFSRPMLHLFTTDETVIEIGAYMMLCIIPSYIIYVIVEILSGALRGLGDVLVPTIVVLTGVCVFRLPWILLVTPLHPELLTVMMSYPIAWSATVLMLTPYYFYRKRKNK
jgi:putative MATE family efflux protein